MEAANNAAVISNGVNTDCNIENITIYDMLSQNIYFFFVTSQFFFLQYEYLTFVNGIFVEFIVRANYLVPNSIKKEIDIAYEQKYIQTSSAGVLSRV